MSTPASKVIDVQIISDNICPFCYLGKKKLEAASKLLPPGVTLRYDWRPFQLDPTLPGNPGMNKLERYEKKFGTQRVGPILEQMKKNGIPYGINFSFGGKIGNTINSHRLIEWTKSAELGQGAHTDRLITKLFHAYFESERDISDIDTLITISQEAELPVTSEEVRQFLKSDKLRSEVMAGVKDAQEADISGVPHFIIGGQYSVSGAQEPETFKKIFDKIL